MLPLTTMKPLPGSPKVRGAGDGKRVEIRRGDQPSEPHAESHHAGRLENTGAMSLVGAVDRAKPDLALLAEGARIFDRDVELPGGWREAEGDRLEDRAPR